MKLRSSLTPLVSSSKLYLGVPYYLPDADFWISANGCGRISQAFTISKDTRFTPLGGKFFPFHGGGRICCVILYLTPYRDDKFDYTGKRVALIGNGSSALQILPRLAKTIGSGSITNFIRNPTWVSATYLSQFTKDGGNFEYTEEEKKKFTEDYEAHKNYRHLLEHNFNMFLYVLFKDSAAQKACFEAYSKMMAERLNHDPVLCEKLIPKWEVGCRRLSPGEGYLESFSQPNVSANFSPIKSITETSIVTEDGPAEFDAIIFATGFDVSYVPPWEITGKNGFDLKKHFDVPVPKAYMSINVENMPNYFIFNGPNACAGHGSLLAVMDWTSAHIARWAMKIAKEDIK